ncbi:hypothetical protein [Microvirga sp. CF3016]|uniref:hypothetical protein n=1 Tax=Microvirga sp. CF3016 TaxID=3110181 RepID=UPI002E774CCF|nr:hypothetical protein [Microvirga sp. CF3016]MEE1610896.1 hypothetical protein [Microvirga sp. CF3016]
MTRATDEHASVSFPAAPLSWQLIGGFAVACAAAIILFLGAVAYARKDVAGGALVAAGGAVRVVPKRSGVGGRM